MSDETDFWSATVAEFAPLQLSGPELLEKHLKRPPFRFIHDIVTAINERFQVYTTVFTPEQLVVSNIDTKEQKIDYLTRLVEFLAKILPHPHPVNVKKIVAGQEPEKTNAFLRDLALGVRYANAYLEKQGAAPPSPPPPSAAAQAPAPPPGADLSSSAAIAEERDKLPKLRKRVDRGVEEMKKASLLESARNFNQKVNRYNLPLGDTAETAGVANAKLVAMHKELNDFHGYYAEVSKTQPATMPPEALELAISRQVETIRQLAAVQRENEELIALLLEQV